MRTGLAALSLAFVLAACGGQEPAPAAGTAPPVPPAPAPEAGLPEPLPPGVPAADLASTVALAPRQAQEWDDLHNVYRLSDDILSGSEPHGVAALERIAAMGVKTVLSVDGKAPDVEAAAALGLRYVHVPIQYRGITADERLRLAKVFRELPGPFYVHCFHGKHRGPAAAALGRIVLDGASREQAIAEMRQWCGTSPKYTGLFETIARGALPEAEQTASFAYDFPAAVRFEGMRETMIEIARAWDHLEALASGGLAADPAHPDLHAGNESVQLASVFAAATELPETGLEPEDFRAWMSESKEHAATLRDAVAALVEEPARLAEAEDALEALKARCDACHKVYRNR